MTTTPHVPEAAFGNTNPAQFLGELPKRENRPALNEIPYQVFTAAQMRAYATEAVQRALAAQQQAVAAERERCQSLANIAVDYARDADWSRARAVLGMIQNPAAPQQAAPATDKDSLTVEAAAHEKVGDFIRGHDAGWQSAIEHMKAQQAAPAPAAPEPIGVEAAAEVIDGDDGPELQWLVEGGIYALPVGACWCSRIGQSQTRAAAAKCSRHPQQRRCSPQ